MLSRKRPPKALRDVMSAKPGDFITTVSQSPPPSNPTTGPAASGVTTWNVPPAYSTGSGQWPEPAGIFSDLSRYVNDMGDALRKSIDEIAELKDIIQAQQERIELLEGDIETAAWR